MLNKDRKAAVIMANYNHKQFVEQAAMSVIQQGYINTHFYAIDDYSTDGSWEMLREIQEQYPRRMTLLRSEKNQGISNCWNQLLDEVRRSGGTNYLIPFSSDDVLYPDAVRDRVLFLEAHPEFDIILSDFDVMDEAGNIYSREDKAPECKDVPEAHIFHHLLPGNFLQICSSIINVNSTGLDALTNDPLCPNLGDWDMWLRLSMKHSFGHFPQKTLHCRRHSHNMSKLPYKVLAMKLYIWSKAMLLTEKMDQQQAIKEVIRRFLEL